MAKQSGLGMRFWVDGYDLSGDIQTIDRIAGPLSTLEFTDITEFAHERQGGHHDGMIEVTSYFDAATGQSHPVFSALPTTDRIMSVAIPTASALAIGDPIASIVAKQLNYDGTRDNNGNFPLKISGQANGYGLEWGKLLTAGTRADTTATNGTSYDGGASTSFGGQLYLHVISVTGTSCTVKLQDSADNSTFADVTSGAFTAAASAPQSQRIALAGNATVRRYVRIATTGTFSQCSFVVGFTRNLTAVTF